MSKSRPWLDVVWPGTFFSEDKTRQADVSMLPFHDPPSPRVVYLIKAPAPENWRWVYGETLEGKTQEYAENEAKNWCLGIKKLPYETK